MIPQNSYRLTIRSQIILSLLFSFMLANAAFAQNASTSKVSSAIQWKFDTTVDGVAFYHAITKCNGTKAVFLKFDNKNSYPVKATWKEVFTTQIERKKESLAGPKELIISKGVTMPTGCRDNNNKKNVILSSQVDPTYVAEILDFELKNIAVSKIK